MNFCRVDYSEPEAQRLSSVEDVTAARAVQVLRDFLQKSPEENSGATISNHASAEK